MAAGLSNYPTLGFSSLLTATLGRDEICQVRLLVSSADLVNHHDAWPCLLK